MPRHRIPDEFRRRQIEIDLVGVGGTGSRVLTELVELHVALRSFGHPGLRLYAYDPDVVSSSNIGRTSFCPSDIGQYKVSVLLDRVNRAYGLMWRGIPEPYRHPARTTERLGASADLVITCTDSLRSRAELHREMFLGPQYPPRYWLDCGNGETTGQVILGEPEWAPDFEQFERRARLHTVADVFPEMLEAADGEEPDPESCTLAVALGKQSLTINRWMATAAFELLWQMFRNGGLDYNAVWVNAGGIRVNPEYRATPPGGRVVEEPPVAIGAPALPETTERRYRTRRLRAKGGRVRR